MPNLGLFPYIDKTDASEIMVGTTEYEVHVAAKDFLERYVDEGDKISFELTDAGKIFKVTVYDGDITVTANDSFTDLVIGGDLTVTNNATLNTKGVTVKGDTTVDVGAKLISNTTFEGDVTVNGTAEFTNVTVKKALKVTGTATIKNSAVADLEVVSGANVAFVDKVTVSGDIVGADLIDVDEADEATAGLVEDKVADEKDALYKAAEAALDDYEDALDALEAAVKTTPGKYLTAEEAAEAAKALAQVAVTKADDEELTARKNELDARFEDIQAVESSEHTVALGDTAVVSFTRNIDGTIAVDADAVEEVDGKYIVKEESAAYTALNDQVPGEGGTSDVGYTGFKISLDEVNNGDEITVKAWANGKERTVTPDANNYLRLYTAIADKSTIERDKAEGEEGTETVGVWTARIGEKVEWVLEWYDEDDKLIGKTFFTTEIVLED